MRSKNYGHTLNRKALTLRANLERVSRFHASIFRFCSSQIFVARAVPRGAIDSVRPRTAAMPHDEDHENSTTNANGDVDETQSQKAPNPPPPAQRWSLFSIPSPLRQLFNKFPLVTYAANDLPARASGSRERHALYIFATEESAREGRPSYNPGCLKWQVCLLARSFVKCF